LTDNFTVSEHLKLNISHENSVVESKKTSLILGVEEIPFEVVECSKLKFEKELMQKLESIIFERKIDTVFMHFKDDYNQDHKAAYELCKTAARHCKNLMMYQSNGYSLSTPFYPSIFSDISEFAEKKLAALNMYAHQHNRFAKLFDTTMKRNAAWEYAEAFCPIKFSI